MLPYLLVPVGLIAIGLASSGKSSNRGSTGCGSLDYQRRRRDFASGNRLGPAAREPINCPPMPWMPERINGVIYDGIMNGVLDERALLLMALHTVYDETVDGYPISWPARPDDCAALKALEERTRSRVRSMLAAHEDDLADEVYSA